MTTENAVKLWYVARDGKQTGPISEAEIVAIAAHGYFRQTDLVWRPGMAEWRSALAVFPSASSAMPPTAPPPAPAPTHGLPSGNQAPYESARPDLQPTGAQPTTGRPTTGRPAPSPPYSQRQGVAQSGLPQSGLPQSGLPQTGPAYGSPSSSSQSVGLGQPDPSFRSAVPQASAAPRPLATMPETRGFEPETVKPRTNRMAIAALAITLLAITGGVYVAAEPQITKSGALEPVRRAFASLSGAVNGLLADPSEQIANLENSLQATAHWPVIKREFPDWYGERLREAAQLSSQNRTPDEITKMLAERIVALRRQNASQALLASAPRLMAVANAFLANLKQLKQSSPQVCYTFISQGELTPSMRTKLKDAETPPPGIQLQVAAVFEAIAEGRKTPVTYEKPQKADYDALMAELGKLGWTQDDVSIFANPRSLARTEPARVCQMVQDWFVAHIAIADENSRQRLIGETLRPVVSG